jgi:hypothetical protein
VHVSWQPFALLHNLSKLSRTFKQNKMVSSVSGTVLSLCLLAWAVYGEVRCSWTLFLVGGIPPVYPKIGRVKSIRTRSGLASSTSQESAASQLRRQLTFNGKITALQLYNADKDTKIVDLVNGTIVYLTSIPGMTKPSFNINADYNGTVRSVIYFYNGAKSRTEAKAPYAFCGNDGTNFFSCDKLGCGNHTVSAIPYSGDRAQGEAGGAYTVTFSIVCPPPVPPSVKITALSLINADKDTKILDLANGTVVNVKDIPGMVNPSFNINASYTGAVESVVYWYNGTRYLLEIIKPYAFCGNDRTNFFSCRKLTCGTHTVTAIPYVQGGGRGTPGTPLTVTFTIVCVPPAPTAPKPPTMSPVAKTVGWITALELYNADNDTKVVDLKNGTVVVSKSPSFNINAKYNGTVESVAFTYNNTRVELEDKAPFAFCGNNNTDFFKCRELGCGNHTVSATPYSEEFGRGMVGYPYAVSFSIVC